MHQKVESNKKIKIENDKKEEKIEEKNDKKTEKKSKEEESDDDFEEIEEFLKNDKNKKKNLSEDDSEEIEEKKTKQSKEEKIEEKNEEKKTNLSDSEEIEEIDKKEEEKNDKEEEKNLLDYDSYEKKKKEFSDKNIINMINERKMEGIFENIISKEKVNKIDKKKKIIKFVGFEIVPNEILFKIFVEFQEKPFLTFNKDFFEYFKETDLYKLKNGIFSNFPKKKDFFGKISIENIAHHFKFKKKNLKKKI
jgi:hypothetical protein